MGFFSDFVELAADAVTAPIEVVKDVVTLGGLATGKYESYTSKRIKKLAEDAESIIDD